MTNKNLISQALDALTKCANYLDELPTWSACEHEANTAHAAITDLRSALAAPMPEPVAWYLPSSDGDDSIFRDHRTVVACTGNKWEGFLPLYAAPPAAPADEWRQAIEDELICYHIGTAQSFPDAKAALKNLIDWHVLVALDPAVSSDAQALIDKGKSAAPAVPLTDERAAFEAWIRKDCGDLTTFGSGSNMHYRNSAVNNAWTGWHARAVLSAAPVVRESQDERDARIEALQTECDASNMEVIELTAEVAALRAEVANLTKIIDEAWGEA